MSDFKPESFRIFESPVDSKELREEIEEKRKAAKEETVTYGFPNLDNADEVRVGRIDNVRNANEFLLLSPTSNVLEESKLMTTLFRNKIDVSELRKSIDTAIVELIPKGELNPFDTVPRSLLTDAEKIIADQDNQIDSLYEELNGKVADLAAALANANASEAQINALQSQVDSLRNQLNALLSGGGQSPSNPTNPSSPSGPTLPGTPPINPTTPEPTPGAPPEDGEIPNEGDPFELPPFNSKLPDVSMIPHAVAYPPVGGQGPGFRIVDVVPSGPIDGLGFEYSGPGYPRIYEVGTGVRRVEFNANDAINTNQILIAPQLGGGQRPDVYPGVGRSADGSITEFHFYAGNSIAVTTSRLDNGEYSLNDSTSNVIKQRLASKVPRPKIYFEANVGFGGFGRVPEQIPDPIVIDALGLEQAKALYRIGTAAAPVKPWLDPTSQFYRYPAVENYSSWWIIEQVNALGEIERWTYNP